MEPLFGFAIDLPPRRARDLLGAVHRQLRSAILDGRLKPGLRLPATRAAAVALGVSRNTVIAAYDLLLSEGYLVARRGSGTFVAENLSPPRRFKARSAAPELDRRLAPFWRALPPLPPARAASFRYDFRIGLSDKASFPFHIWRRLSARALRALSKAPSAYAEPEGRPALRGAIAKHIAFARAVACNAEDIVVTAGAQQAFDLLARILVTPGRTMAAFENPGYPPLRDAFAAAGAAVRPVPVDGEGLVVERLPTEARIVCVTPSHHSPLGPTMSLRRRTALLEFAHARGAAIVEDDYDGEFRFAGRPLDALQTLDRGESVFYVGTFSKSLFPALRLGFVVAPPWARPALIAAKRLTDWHGPVLAQDTLAPFIAEGHLARHLRKMRRVYAERRAILLKALAHHCPGRIVPIPSEAGMHIAARLAGDLRADAVAARAAAAGIGVQSLGAYFNAKPARNGLAFGFGMIQAERIDEGIRRLAEVIR
ncbi:MAG TPA: PLP-dependent aminotransferase family protein [Alphaproteobacteria bacterium]